MSDCAAHLVDEVLPKVPVRQWVCSLPWQLRYAMGYDAGLCSAVLAAFLGALRRSLRRRAKQTCDLSSVEDAQFGAVTFIQRADSSLRLNVHFHCLVLDGVYVRGPAGPLHFHALPRPTLEQVAEVARWTPEAIARVLAQRGRTLDGFDAADEALAESGGVNVHVGPAIDGRDRKRLERLCRYMARPPVCQERLAVTASGRSWSASNEPGAAVCMLWSSTRSTSSRGWSH
jgi:hypothetical protein